MNIELLSAEAFRPFGNVIEARDNAEHFTINYGYTERYHNLASIDVTAAGGEPGASIFVSTPLSLPMSLNIMERHPLSSQAFIPLGQEPYLVLVAPKGDFDVKKMRVFLAQPDQGVNYHAGTWHHFCLALNSVSRFLVIDRVVNDKSNAVNNCDEVTLKPEISIDRAALEHAVQKSQAPSQKMSTGTQVEKD